MDAFFFGPIMAFFAVVYIGVVIYVLVLVTRLVKAVERIADKLAG